MERNFERVHRGRYKYKKKYIRKVKRKQEENYLGGEIRAKNYAQNMMGPVSQTNMVIKWKFNFL